MTIILTGLLLYTIGIVLIADATIVSFAGENMGMGVAGYN